MVLKLKCLVIILLTKAGRVALKYEALSSNAKFSFACDLPILTCSLWVLDVFCAGRKFACLCLSLLQKPCTD